MGDRPSASLYKIGVVSDILAKRASFFRRGDIFLMGRLETPKQTAPIPTSRIDIMQIRRPAETIKKIGNTLYVVALLLRIKMLVNHCVVNAGDSICATSIEIPSAQDERGGLGRVRRRWAGAGVNLVDRARPFLRL